MSITKENTCLGIFKSFIKQSLFFVVLPLGISAVALLPIAIDDVSCGFISTGLKIVGLSALLISIFMLIYVCMTTAPYVASKLLDVDEFIQTRNKLSEIKCAATQLFYMQISSDFKKFECTTHLEITPNGEVIAFLRDEEGTDIENRIHHEHAITVGCLDKSIMGDWSFSNNIPVALTQAHWHVFFFLSPCFFSLPSEMDIYHKQGEKLKYQAEASCKAIYKEFFKSHPEMAQGDIKFVAVRPNGEVFGFMEDPCLLTDVEYTLNRIRYIWQTPDKSAFFMGRITNFGKVVLEEYQSVLEKCNAPTTTLIRDVSERLSTHCCFNTKDFPTA